MSPLLTVTGLTKGFGGVRAVDGCSFEVGEARAALTKGALLSEEYRVVRADGTTRVMRERARAVSWRIVASCGLARSSSSPLGSIFLWRRAASSRYTCLRTSKKGM